MKHSSPMLALLAVVSISSGCELLMDQQRVQETWPNGEKKREGELVLGLQEGVWTHYHPNGRPKARGAYVADVQNGPWEFWYENAAPEMSGRYDGERRDGIWTYYHRSGDVRAAGAFDHGQEDGTWTYWNSQGVRQQRGEFFRGRQHLRWQYWDDTGRKKAEGYFYDGHKVGPWTIYDENGGATQKFFALPEGLELVCDRWEDSNAVRREGFLSNGKRTGMWITWNADGSQRVCGVFEEDVPVGAWLARRGNGEVLASGEMQDGRMSGTWTIGSFSGEREWRAEGVRPPEPIFGRWSEASLVDRDQPESVVGTWISEMRSTVEPTAVIAVAGDWEQGVAATLVAEPLGAFADVRPEAPVQALPITVREEREFESYVNMYGIDPGPLTGDAASKYGAARSASSSRTGGDEAKAARILGKQLDSSAFIDTNGQKIDLVDYRGRKVVFIVLRGFNGGICVYCMAQTKAYCKEGAFDEFQNLGVDVLVLFPGTKGKVDEFARAYERAAGEMDIPYKILREDPEMGLPKELDILANEVSAFPTTLVIDETGVVRFAYVGVDKGDRPSAKMVLDALREMDP